LHVKTMASKLGWVVSGVAPREMGVMTDGKETYRDRDGRPKNHADPKMESWGERNERNKLTRKGTADLIVCQCNIGKK
jgi:hypothetical protein